MSCFTLFERNKILEKTNGYCACCGKPLDLKTLSIDHYIPRSRGGDSRIINLYPLCEDCNSKKASEIYYGDECYPLLNVGYESALNLLYNEWENNFIRHFWANVHSISVRLRGVRAVYDIETKQIKRGEAIHDSILDLGKIVKKMLGVKWVTDSMELRDIKFNQWIDLKTCSVKFNGVVTEV